MYESSTIAKAHRVASDSYRKLHYRIGVPAAILAGLAGVSAFTDNPLVAGVLAVLVAALTGATTFISPAQMMDRHDKASKRYSELTYRFLDLFPEVPPPGKPLAAVKDAYRKAREDERAADESTPSLAKRHLDYVYKKDPVEWDLGPLGEDIERTMQQDEQQEEKDLG